MPDGYVKALIQRFGTAQALADFMGVSVHVVWSWSTGRRQPDGASLRMLQVLGVLANDAPALLRVLVGQEGSPKCAPIVLPPLRPLPTFLGTSAAIAVMSDAWWYERTVTDPDDEPAVRHDVALLSSWADEREVAFSRSCRDYETRTGRSFPT